MAAANRKPMIRHINNCTEYTGPPLSPDARKERAGPPSGLPAAQHLDLREE